MSLQIKMIAGAVLGLALGASPAEAALVNFSLTGPTAASWQIDTDIPPDFASIDLISYYGVLGDFADTFPASGTSGVDIDFWGEADGGGFRFTDFETGDIVAVSGAPLFIGTTFGPEFISGTFALTGSYTLSISNAVAAVPEPASWALMFVGFGLIGCTMRCRVVKFDLATV